MWARLRRLFVKESGDNRKIKERQKADGLPSHFKISRKKLSWGRHRTSGEPPTPTKLQDKKQMKKEMDRLTSQLQLMTMERNDLRDRLTLITEGSLANWPNHRPNPFYERLKTKHEKLLLDLQTLEQEHTEASQNFEKLEKESSFYRNLHSRLLREQTQLMKKVDMMKQNNETVQENWVLLKHQLAKMQQICKDQEEETSDLQTEQLDKERERLEKLLNYVRKQTQLAIQERDLAIKMQQQFEDLWTRSENLHLELDQDTAHEESLLQKELLHQEPPAEPQPQETQNSWEGLSYTEWVSSV